MTRLNVGDGGGGAPVSPSSNLAEDADVSIPFVLADGNLRFAPDVYPETVRVIKGRKLNRNDNFCGGEDVADQGSENKEIHVNGHIKPDLTGTFWDLVNEGRTIELTSPAWSGEVRAEEFELEGPTGFDPESRTFFFEYTIDLVSTGKDEPGGPVEDDGIIDDGTSGSVGTSSATPEP